jgi:hypothetical protein
MRVSLEILFFGKGDQFPKKKVQISTYIETVDPWLRLRELEGPTNILVFYVLFGLEICKALSILSFVNVTLLN